MTDHSLPFTDIVRGLPATIPFVGPETLERRLGKPFRARLGANESAFGVSPKVAEAITAAISHISWYNDPEGYELYAAISARHNVQMNEICLGAGIDEILGNVVRMIVQPGTPVVTSLGAYPTFNYHVNGFGGKLCSVPYKNDHIDLGALAAEVQRTGAPLVYLANPDNPMGTWLTAERIKAFIDQLPQNTLFIYDEAYVEFAPDDVQFPVDTTDPRVIRMRTFSKAYGMAGARIGYALAASEVITELGKIRNHFGVNRLAQAGALAALQDDAFLTSVIERVSEGRQEYYALAERLGLSYIPSATNFVAIDVGSGDRARKLLARLQEQGVFIRMPGVAPLDRCIRVSVGTPEERALFADVFSSEAAR